MPVYTQTSQLPDGGIWTSILVRIPQVKVAWSCSGICDTQNAARHFLYRNALKFWSDKLNSYLNSREKALNEVGVITPGIRQSIAIARQAAIRTTPTCHETWCRRVLMAQDHILMLLPAAGSAHAYWRFYVQELLQYCHACIKNEAEKEALKPQLS